MLRILPDLLDHLAMFSAYQGVDTSPAPRQASFAPCRGHPMRRGPTASSRSSGGPPVGRSCEACRTPAARPSRSAAVPRPTTGPRRPQSQRASPRMTSPCAHSARVRTCARTHRDRHSAWQQRSPWRSSRSAGQRVALIEQRVARLRPPGHRPRPASRRPAGRRSTPRARRPGPRDLRRPAMP